MGVAPFSLQGRRHRLVRNDLAPSHESTPFVGNDPYCPVRGAPFHLASKDLL